MWESILASVAGSAVSGLLGADSAGDAANAAANAQTQAAATATAEQRRQFDLNRQDLAPYREAGSAAIGRLRQLMGLSGGGSSGGGVTYSTPKSLQQIIGELRASGQFSGVPTPPAGYRLLKQGDRYLGLGPDDLYGQFDVVDLGSGGDGPLMAEAMRQFESQTPVAVGGGEITGQTDYQLAGDSPLLRRFTMDDFYNDPVIQKSFEFGLSEGEKAVQRMFGARGMSRSGAAVKAATRFATDYTGTKAGESQARFSLDQGNIFNKLAAVSGIGQAATNTGVSSGTAITNSIASNAIGEGNARGAAAIARGNATSGAFSNIGNSVSNAFNLDRILSRSMTPTPFNPNAGFSLDSSAWTGGLISPT